MERQRPRITEDGHLVYDQVPAEKDTTPDGQEPTARTSPDATEDTTAHVGRPQRDTTDEPTAAHGGDGGHEGAPADPRPRPKRWRWVVAAVVAVALLLGGYALWNRLTMPDGEGTVTVGETGSGGSAADTRKAEEVALDYTAAGIAAEAKKMCAYEVDPDDCYEVAKLSDPLVATDPPHVIQSAPVSRPSGVTGGEVTATAVLVEYTIKDQANAQREIVFVRDSDHKVLGTERIGDEDAGKSLQMIFREEGAA